MMSLGPSQIWGRLGAVHIQYDYLQLAYDRLCRNVYATEYKVIERSYE
jgi:hypothetical protein